MKMLTKVGIFFKKRVNVNPEKFSENTEFFT